jgi:hypothetical protein
LNRIEDLNLSTNIAITDAGISNINLGGKSHLRVLDLTDSSVDDNAMAEISKLPELRTLNLQDTDVGDEGLRHVKNIVHLEGLCLSNDRKITASAFAQIDLSSMRELQSLDVSLTAIDDRCLSAIPL